MIAPSCKIHNDASCDISSDGKLLATFVPSAQGFPDDGVVAVYSLENENLGQCIFTKKFGKSSIYVQLSSIFCSLICNKSKIEDKNKFSILLETFETTNEHSIL